MLQYVTVLYSNSAATQSAELNTACDDWSIWWRRRNIRCSRHHAWISWQHAQRCYASSKGTVGGVCVVYLQGCIEKKGRQSVIALYELVYY
jgi:hypothetical protein